MVGLFQRLLLLLSKIGIDAPLCICLRSEPVEQSIGRAVILGMESIGVPNFTDRLIHKFDYGHHSILLMGTNMTMGHRLADDYKVSEINQYLNFSRNVSRLKWNINRILMAEEWLSYPVYFYYLKIGLVNMKDMPFFCNILYRGERNFSAYSSFRS